MNVAMDMDVPEISYMISIEPINNTNEAHEDMDANIEREHNWRNDIVIIGISYICLFLHALNVEYCYSVCVFNFLFPVWNINT